MNGNTIKAIRYHYGLSQKELASKLGISAPYLCAIEAGRREVSERVRIKLAQLFDFDDSNTITAIKRARFAYRLVIV